MTKKESVMSKEFKGPFVRVRGRISRKNEVKWSPCLRTFRKLGYLTRPGKFESKKYLITFEDKNKNILAKAPTNPEFYAVGQEWASFGQRLPYHQETKRVVLRRGKKELGVLEISNELPQFALVHPLKSDEIDTNGIMHIQWEFKKDSQSHPLTFFVRFSPDGKRWIRPGVNLKSTEYNLDLREMPGGDNCTVQILATNGYQTAFIETPTFKLPRKQPEIFLGNMDGPVLYAQGFSKEYGPILDDNIIWLSDKKQIATGGLYDVRKLRSGIHQLGITVKDPSGQSVHEAFGSYDGRTGLRVSSKTGL